LVRVPLGVPAFLPPQLHLRWCWLRRVCFVALGDSSSFGSGFLHVLEYQHEAGLSAKKHVQCASLSHSVRRPLSRRSAVTRPRLPSTSTCIRVLRLMLHVMVYGLLVVVSDIRIAIVRVSRLPSSSGARGVHLDSCQREVIASGTVVDSESTSCSVWTPRYPRCCRTPAGTRAGQNIDNFKFLAKGKRGHSRSAHRVFEISSRF
jgi:hypothetical protein